jgi:hypothetical protein
MRASDPGGVSNPDRAEEGWMSWWSKAPWADRERPGIQLLWVSALISGLVVLFLLVDQIF